MNKLIYMVSFTLLLLSFPVSGFAEEDKTLSSIDLEEAQQHWEKSGYSEDAIEKMTGMIENGTLPDNMKNNEKNNYVDTKVTTEETESHLIKTEKKYYKDGTYDIVESKIEKQNVEDGISLQVMRSTITEKISRSTGTVNMSFRAKFVISTAGDDSLLRVWDPRITTVGGVVSSDDLSVLNKIADSTQPAQARYRAQVDMAGDVASRTFVLTLNVQDAEYWKTY
ncbi:hypothetical protein D7Z54_32710 [Salibacterium salarium]|uniref:Uncharacterized protein n=1 Tax=Salibacterium salarium TaxID=284579 RepID=A0A3R9P1X3_9BACI|nr:hypothetical protein [Salibacterium salarium]RSL29169.1 hypothetical protein D7Z54_32710 [Salibacterium salarium]